MSDRYRDMSPNPGHFLANSTPLSSNDTYTTYLSSTVHTPVKRYIPTPVRTPKTKLNFSLIFESNFQPLTCTNDQTSQYSDGPTLSNPGYHLSLPAQNSLTQIGSSQTLKPSKSRMSQQQQQQQQAPQYRINMKCCSDSQKQQISTATLPLPSSSHTDHYATTPRIRPTSVSAKQSGSGISNSSTATSICCAQSQTGSQCDYGTRGQTVDYGTTSRVVTPINLMSQTDQSCLNCRRTTGVHQTTQTTGPIR
jgi:hypothetical protein